LPGKHFEADPTLGEVVDGIDQVTQIPSEPIELSYDQCVSFPQGLQGSVETRLSIQSS
jgi:hypothetical protein